MTYKNLTNGGLTEAQAFIYDFLLKNGELNARKIYQNSHFKRGLIYKSLNELIALGLVEKNDRPGKVATFLPLHPLKLKELAEKREFEAKDAQLAISSLLPNLISDFNFSFGAPGVSFYRGLEGLERVYEDINHDKNDLLLFRSPFDNDSKELVELVKEQIKQQTRLGIRTLALTPIDKNPGAHFLDKDEANLVTRRMVPRDSFLIGSQIIVYGKKVAITSLKSDFVTTLINNENIAETFKVIFRLLWQLAEPGHLELKKEIESKKALFKEKMSE